jgi:eukaryotic-like serine/threonine-protein kinase
LVFKFYLLNIPDMSPNQFEVPAMATVAALLPAFEVECLISESDTGIIYKARQISLDREVAIKILPEELAQSPYFRTAFEAQAKAMAGLTHTNLIRVFDTGEVQGMLYMVMEYVPGKSLQKSAHGVAVDAMQAVGIISSTCEGLAHAHENGITHYNLNPSNILLNQEAKPKITNFGITHSSNTLKNLAYAAPEIARNLEQGTKQSDIFAIGMILRELLTGTPAGSEKFHSTAVANRKLAAICDKATHEDPEHRYQDTSSFNDALELWNVEKPVKKLVTSAHPKSYRSSLAKQPNKYTRKTSSSRWPLFRNCGIIAVLLCSINFVWGLYQNKQATLARLQMEQDSKYPTIRIISSDTEAGTNNSSF